MGTVILGDVDELTTIKISELPALASANSDSVLPIVDSESTYKIAEDDLHKFGDETNYTKFDTDGKIRFYGNARPTRFIIVDSTTCYPTHALPLKITSLTESAGITTTDLDTEPGLSRRIEVTGINGGMYVKGRLVNVYTQNNTTGESSIVKITISTTNATWEQSGEWHLIINVLSGNVTGPISVHAPAFSITQYGKVDFYVTTDGACYATLIQNGFDFSVAGPHAADELFLNNESAGSDVVVQVASTTGFYVGNEVFVSDSENSEWTRISAIVTDTSITVDLTNSYTTVNGAEFITEDYVKTPPMEPVQRGLFKSRIFKAGENSGIQAQVVIPQQADSGENLRVMFQYVSTADNPGLAMVSKWRLQYSFKALGEDAPANIQYGELAYADIIPPPSKSIYLDMITEITPEIHQGKYVMFFQLARMANDDGDTYTGDIRLGGIIVENTWKQLGYEV